MACHLRSRLPLHSFVAVYVALSCGRPGAAPFDLAPRDSLQWLSVSVEDAAEVGLLEQELKVRIVRVEDGKAYLIDSPGLRERLTSIGYEPTPADRQTLEKRIVRVMKRGPETALLETGVELINREDAHWVVRGSLATLRSLQRMGYRLQAVSADEPRPREIRITVKTRQDVVRIAAQGVDIYSARETEAGITVYAGAFDNQIDRLRAAGFDVQRIPSPR